MKTFSWRNDPGIPEVRPVRYYVCDTVSELPSDFIAGDMAAVIDTAQVFLATDQWVEVGTPGRSERSKG